MAVKLNPPKRRRCVLCGREDAWSEDEAGWVIQTKGGEKAAGDRFCLHEWDITGTHTPITDEA